MKPFCVLPHPSNFLLFFSSSPHAPRRRGRIFFIQLSSSFPRYCLSPIFLFSCAYAAAVAPPPLPSLSLRSSAGGRRPNVMRLLSLIGPLTPRCQQKGSRSSWPSGFFGAHLRTAARYHTNSPMRDYLLGGYQHFE